MKKVKTLGVYIGRFQPVHVGHLSTIRQGLEKFDNFLVLIGSSNSSRSVRNPWSAEERERMILSNFSDDPLREKLIVSNLPDFLYQEEMWATCVQNIVSYYADNDTQISICGLDKDESSYYLKSFPQWKQYFIPAIENKGAVIHATSIRNAMFEDILTAKKLSEDYLSIRPKIPFVTKSTADIIQEFLQNKEFPNILDEYVFVQKYKEEWANSPYPPTFNTVDAVVVCSGHILTIVRKDNPGKGMIALPGGFVNQNETLKDSMVRELKEETRLKLPEKTIKNMIQSQHVFDDPNRSTRGRTITHGFFVHIPPGKLPEVRGGDDAKSASWMPISEFLQIPTMIYEDHYHIAKYFLGVN